MPEIKRILQPIEVQYRCDKCHIGTMKYDGRIIIDKTPQYPHVCDNCGFIFNFEEVYPYTKLEKM